jgi:hypothetical protein
MTTPTIDTSFLSLLTPEGQVNVLVDLFKQKNYEASKTIFKALNFDAYEEEALLNMLEKTHYHVLNDKIDSDLIQLIDEVNLKYTKKSIIERVKRNEKIYYFDDIFINQENFHYMMELSHLLPMEEEREWIDLIVRKMPCNIYISFDEKDILNNIIFKHFHSLHSDYQIKLLSQTNLIEHLNLKKNFFKDMDNKDEA